jgi:sialidase-1
MHPKSQTKRLLTAGMLTGAVLGTAGVASAVSGQFSTPKVATKAPIATTADDGAAPAVTVAGAPATTAAKPAKKKTVKPTTTVAGSPTTVKKSDDKGDDKGDDKNDDKNDDTPRTTLPRATTTTVAGATTTAPAATTTTTTAAATTTTAAATTTTTVPKTTTTAAATTTTTVPKTTTTAPATTIPATTIPATTVPATTTTTAAPKAVISVSANFTAVASAGSLKMPINIVNSGNAAAASATATITMKGAALPHFLEVQKTTAVGWTCSAYAEIPATTQTYTCTGPVAAASTVVLTVSSGSTIGSTGAPVGTPVQGNVSVAGAGFTTVAITATSAYA